MAFPKGNQLRKGKIPWNMGLTKEDSLGIMVHSLRMKGEGNISKRLDVKLKMSLAKKGKSSNNYGKHWKVKDTTKIINAAKFRKGIPRTEKVKALCREKARIRVLEGKHNFWKGGVTPLIILIRRLPEYNEWRKKIYKRDNYKCFFGCNERVLIAHHIMFFSDLVNRYKIKSVDEALNCPAIWDTNNGLTVCKNCHNKIHSESQINQFNKKIYI